MEGSTEKASGRVSPAGTTIGGTGTHYYHPMHQHGRTNSKGTGNGERTVAQLVHHPHSSSKDPTDSTYHSSHGSYASSVGHGSSSGGGGPGMSAVVGRVVPHHASHPFDGGTTTVGGASCVVEIDGGGAVGAGSNGGGGLHRTGQPAAAGGSGNGVGFRPDIPTSVIVWQRLSVLVTLLLLQSGSQFILERYEGLIQANVIIPLFLTMLVGAGGNAGNQAAVHSITGLVTGEYRQQSWSRVVRKELWIGLVCSSVLFVIGYMRVHYFYTMEENIATGMFETVFAISFSLFAIVLSSVVLGSLLPFCLLYAGVNVEHAAPIIQVVMDILGVLISCLVCSQFLPSSLPTNSPGVIEGAGVVPTSGT